MPTFQLMPGAKSLSFDGYAPVKADARGRVRVSEDQARAIRGSSAKKRYDSILEVAAVRSTSSRNDPTCACGYAFWKWQTKCPKCGAELKQE